jgi:hypothetical protein
VRQQVKVEWNFAPKPPIAMMITLRNGQKIKQDVAHELRPEGIPTKQIWCFGCQEYFPNWHAALWRHGLCVQPPGGKMPEIKTKPVVMPTKKKNDRVPLPDGFADWSVGQMKSWLFKHRPDSYKKIYGRV